MCPLSQCLALVHGVKRNNSLGTYRKLLLLRCRNLWFLASTTWQSYVSWCELNVNLIWHTIKIAAPSQLQDIIYIHSVPHLCIREPPSSLELLLRNGTHRQTTVNMKKAISYGLLSLLWPVGFSLYGDKFCSFKHTIRWFTIARYLAWHESPVTFTG